MSRRLIVLALIAGLPSVLTGCRSSSCQSASCDQRQGLFSHLHAGKTPCQTVGLSGGCFDGATGQPCPCPPGVPSTVVPGPYPYSPGAPFPGTPGLPPGELHMPAPSDMIRPPAVPIPAPGDASLPFPTTPGVPVKNK